MFIQYFPLHTAIDKWLMMINFFITSKLKLLTNMTKIYCTHEIPEWFTIKTGLKEVKRKKEI